MYEVLGGRKTDNYRKQMSSRLRSGVWEGNPIRRGVRTLTGEGLFRILIVTIVCKYQNPSNCTLNIVEYHCYVNNILINKKEGQVHGRFEKRMYFYRL